MGIGCLLLVLSKSALVVENHIDVSTLYCQSLTMNFTEMTLRAVMLCHWSRQILFSVWYWPTRGI